MKLHLQERLFEDNRCSNFAGYIDAFRNSRCFRYAQVQQTRYLHELARTGLTLNKLPRRLRKRWTAIYGPMKNYRMGAKSESELKTVDKSVLLCLQIKANISLGAEIKTLYESARERRVLYHRISSLITAIGCNCARLGDGVQYGPIIFPLLFHCLQTLHLEIFIT